MPTVIDDFSFGPAPLSTGDVAATTEIASHVVDTRTIEVFGAAGLVNTVSGEIGYIVSQLLPTPNQDYWHLTYSVDTLDQAVSFSILGFTSFLLKFTNLVGTGSLQVSVNDGSDFSTHEIPLTNTGDLSIPFGDFGNPDEDRLLWVQFRFTALSPDFSVSIDEIQMLP